MPKSFKKTFLYLTSILSYFLLATPAYAQPKPWNWGCFGSAGDPPVSFATLQCLEDLLANIFSIIIPLAGLAAFIVLIIGGFQYLTSGGDPKQTQKASSIITGAIIGIAVTVGIIIIFNLLKTITNIDLLNFCIPGSSSCAGGNNNNIPPYLPLPTPPAGFP